MRFEGELLPECAQLLDLASNLCPIPMETRQWFSKFSNSAGVDDAATVAAHCLLLKNNIKLHEESILSELRSAPGDFKASQIIQAWVYSLDTIIQETAGKQTCSWVVEGLAPNNKSDLGGGTIMLRRI